MTVAGVHRSDGGNELACKKRPFQCIDGSPISGLNTGFKSSASEADGEGLPTGEFDAFGIYHGNSLRYMLGQAMGTGV